MISKILIIISISIIFNDNDIEEIPLVSSQDALLAIENVNLFVEQQFKEFTNEELKIIDEIFKIMIRNMLTQTKKKI